MSTKLRNFITATAIVAIIASVIYLTISSVLKHKDYVVKHADSYVISFAIRNNEPDYAASISHETSNGKSIDLELRGVDTEWLTSIVKDKQLITLEQKETQNKLDLNGFKYTAHWTEVVDRQNYILKP